MTEPMELVDLPDPGTRRLLHPLDVASARPDYRTAWLVGTLAGPAVAACIAAVTWFAAGIVAVPLVTFASLTGLGLVARRHYEERAWAHIPRSRQDRGRELPLGWGLAAAVMFAVALTVALLFVGERLTQGDVAPGVRDFVLGGAVAVAALMLIDLAARSVRSRRRALLALPTVLVVLGLVSVTVDRVSRDEPGPEMTTAAWGAATVLLAAAIAAVLQFRNRRPTVGDRT